MLGYRGLGIKAWKCLYERVIVITALYGADAWGMRSAERRKVTVLEMKFLRSLTLVSRMNSVRNEEVHSVEVRNCWLVEETTKQN